MASHAKYFGAAFGTILLSSLVMGQTAYPDHLIQGVSWTHGTKHTAVTQKILSPGTPSAPVSITDATDAEFVSGTQIHLTDGFHAGGFTNDGHFHAYIDNGLGADGDVVTIVPDPATHVIDNVLHVNKWEELEIGLQLPQEYKDAIDRFFAHYYADTDNPYISTPANVDPAHDLNPYADDSLQLVMTLTSPSEAQTLKWGFFMREAKWENALPTARLVEDMDNPLHPYSIHFRCAPGEEGPWQFTLSIQAPNTTTLSGVNLQALTYTGYGFVCEPPLPGNHGSMHVNTTNHRTLEFEDGTGFFGLGSNMADTRRHNSNFPNAFCKRDLEVMQQSMEQLHGTGGNFLRMFLIGKLFAPEMTDIGVYDNYYSSPGCNNEPDNVTFGSGQFQSWSFDRMLEQARASNIYVQLCIEPYPPIIAYEFLGWGVNAYWTQFVLPYLQDPPLNRYDIKRYFFSNGDTDNVNSGAFYYWKRKYKYVMSRWGWSVNIPIIEPFNEIDQLLSYRSRVASNDCPVNNVFWAADPAMPATYSTWLTDIINYVKGPQNLSDPVTSPLGASNKLFLAGTGPEDEDDPNWSQPSNPNWNLPNTNPNVDLVDVHNGLWWGEGELSGSFDKSKLIRNAYTSSTDGSKRPFHQGESNYYALVDMNPIDTITDYYESNKVFDNYDICFYNEIWASTFFGNFAAACTWYWERVFWWPDALPTPIYDVNNPFYQQYPRTSVLGGTNALYIDDPGTPTLVQNRSVYHNFKPLADLLSSPDLQYYDLFNWGFTPHKVYDEANGIECYYLVEDQGGMAVGWVHNLNAYWENHFYVNHTHQNFLGCTSPNAQSITLPGLYWDHSYQINWYSTRMNGIAPPPVNTISSLSGEVTLNVSGLFNGIANNYLDTLHSDYAFIISPAPEHRSMIISNDADTLGGDWNFGLYPNPADDVLNVVLPDDAPTNIAIHDLTGRQVHAWGSVTGPLLRLPVGDLARGAYTVRVADGSHTNVKQLIIR